MSVITNRGQVVHCHQSARLDVCHLHRATFTPIRHLPPDRTTEARHDRR